MGRAICGQITLSKLIDRTSPQFFGLLFRGITTAGPATITFEKSGEQHYDFYKIDLFDVTVQSINQTDPKDTLVTETVVLQANRFRYSYTPQTRTGAPDNPISFGWDCQRAQAF